jgi:glycosyltransferase involved in cell wall biosynthesis
MLTYNRETLVFRAIESILSQTFRDFEFIIVDNGSTDKSGAIADEYATRDSRIHVIHKARGNIGSGRNAGLDTAIGEWIAFIDDDDWCEPDYLEFLYMLAVENDTEIAICGATDKAFDEKCIMTAEEAIIELLWRKKYNVAFPAKLFKAALFDGVRFSDTAKYDDIELMPQILSRAKQIAYHGLPKYTFDRHGGNNSAWTTDYGKLDAATLDEYIAVYRQRTEWLCGRFSDNKDYWRYFEWSFMISMVEKISRLELAGCYSQRDGMVRELRGHFREFVDCEYTQNLEKRRMNTYVIQI